MYKSKKYPIKINSQENIYPLTIGTEEDTVGVFSGKALWLKGESERHRKKNES